MKTTTKRTGKKPNRIGKHWLHKAAVVPRGEKEVCNPAIPEGRAEYKWRTILMWVRQGGWCCFREYEWCPGRLHLRDATFEHQDKRGGMRGRDDRIWNEKTNQPMNGAAHLECNQIAGSRRLKIWHGDAVVIESDSITDAIEEKRRMKEETSEKQLEKSA